ncbi:MAG: HAMP domain-containing protein, partial [Acidobacteriota bacterium]|nr:HAMP domain-containing protein [Acidobacteriota bacterium]
MPGTYGWLDNAVKLKFSLSTRLAAWITILVSFLVMTILFVIQRREVSTIFEETKNRGLLIASYVAYMNLRPLILWDLETIQKNVEDQADDNLVYIVFYDRAGKPLVMNEDVRDDPEIYGGLHLSGDVRPDSRYYSPRTVNLHGRSLDVLEIEIPIFAAGSPARWGALRIGHSLQDMRAEVRKTRQVLIFIGFTGILLGLLGAALFARRVTRPLIKLAEGTVRISQGDFSQHIGLDSKDEIGDLARSFNAMTGQLLQT